MKFLFWLNVAFCIVNVMFFMEDTSNIVHFVVGAFNGVMAYVLYKDGMI